MLYDPKRWATPPSANSIYDPRPEVAACATLFDRYSPDWPQRIDFVKLDMGNSRHCMAGQIFGDFSEGARILGIETNDPMMLEAVALGLEMDRRIIRVVDSTEQYAILEHAWMAEAMRRLAA